MTLQLTNMAERGISLPTQIWYANGEIGDMLCKLQTIECNKLTTSSSTSP